MTDLGPAWIALAGALVGGGLTSMTSIVSARGQRTHERDLAAQAAKADASQRAIHRAAELESARSTYQAETAAELQLAVHRLARCTARLAFEDLVYSREHPTEPYGRQQTSAHWNIEMMRASASVALLGERVADGAVRATCEEVRGVAGAVITATSAAEAAARNNEMLAAFEAASKVVGAYVRALPAPSTYRPLVTGFDVEPADPDPVLNQSSVDQEPTRTDET